MSLGGEDLYNLLLMMKDLKLLLDIYGHETTAVEVLAAGQYHDTSG